MKELNGRVVMITGGAGGVGMGMARAFGGRGAKLVLCDIDPSRTKDCVDELRSQGFEAHGRALDVADHRAWGKTVEEVERTVGPIGVLCNNAGLGAHGPVAEFDIDVWRRVIEINLFGVFYGCRTVLSRMLARREEAHIVNTASLSGMFPRGGSPYITSKFGVVGFSGDLREELKGSNVGVSVLCPAMVRTNFVSNSARVLGADSPGDSAMSGVLAQGVDPDKVGDLVVRSILQGDFYIMTHGEWEPILRKHFDEIQQSFGEGADPNYVGDLAALSAALGREV